MTDMIDLTGIMSALVTLIAAVITSFLIPYLKAKVDADKLAKIHFWVKVAVAAAEQVFSLKGTGEEKKEYVEEFLREKGFTLDMMEIDALIEAAVLELKQSGGENADTEH